MCSAYEEFLKDEQFFDQCVSSTETKQQKRVKWTMESVDILPETKSDGVITHRQSQRVAKPKTNSDYHYYEHRSKRTSTIQTRSSKNTMEQSNAGANRKVNCSMPSNNCNGQTSKRMNAPITQVESANLQKRMNIDRYAKTKLPDISEESNVLQRSVKIKSKNLIEGTTTDNNHKQKSSLAKEIVSRSNQHTVLSKVPEPNERAIPHDSNDSDTHNDSHSFIVIDDFYDALKTNAPKINDNRNDGTNDPPRKSRRLAQRSMTII